MRERMNGGSGPEDVIQSILDAEGRYAGEVEEAKKRAEELVVRRLEEIAAETREGKKRISEENRERLRLATVESARQIREELAMTGEEVRRMKENGDMTGEVKERIVSIVFKR